MSIFSSGLSKEKHHEIFKKVVGTVIPIPSENSGVIVMWEKAKLKISCILPPKTRKCQAMWTKTRKDNPTVKEFEIETPTLLISGNYGIDTGRCPPIPIGDDDTSMSFRRAEFVCDKVSIAALNIDCKDRIMVKPYRLANVYDNSNICWGSNSVPKNLREANNLFWSAPFNCDFGGPYHGRSCSNVEHYYDHSQHNQPRFVHRQTLFAVCICPSHIAEIVADSNICGRCRGISPDRLSAELIERSKAVNGLNLCTLGLCSSSDCKCQCYCCSRNCSCTCNCDLTDEFIIGLKNYATSEEDGRHWPDFYPLPKLAWEDWTRPICGSMYNNKNPMFMSYAGSCDGVFISYDAKFVESQPEEIHRQHSGHKCVIGLYKQTPTGYVIDFGKHQINLPGNKAIRIHDKWESEEQRRERERREYVAQQTALREADRIAAIRIAERRSAENRVFSQGRDILIRRTAGTPLAENETALNLYLNYQLGRHNFDVINELVRNDNRPITSSY